MAPKHSLSLIPKPKNGVEGEEVEGGKVLDHWQGMGAPSTDNGGLL
jgi:hypothetical protein